MLTPDSVLWRGTISLANPEPPGRLRVVVREYELIEADPPAAAISDSPNYVERLVYASVIPWDFPPP